MKSYSDIKLAIHHEGSWNLKWIEYCETNNISHKVVNCYDSDILEQIKGFDGLLWAFHHLLPVDLLMARHVLWSAAMQGVQICPDFNSAWHFDDKVAQKYLFEALDIPAAPAWVFYSRESAMKWIAENSHHIPIVAKLRRGAGSYNVKLLKSQQELISYVARMFGKGYSPAPSGMADVGHKFKVAYGQGGISGITNRLKKAPKFFRIMRQGKKFHAMEKGYVYFQQFIPENECDYRISIVGKRIWGFKRMVRENEFRASGSGLIDYDPTGIPRNLLETSRKIAEKLKMGSVCFDFVKDKAEQYYLIECSYGFIGLAIYDCPGFWDFDLNWNDGHFWPENALIEDFIKAIPRKNVI